MMGICSNRPEGFGPKSTLSSPLPTTCFADTILVPLPIYILPILLLATFLLSKHHQSTMNPHMRARPLRTCGFKSIAITYYILIIANILMEILELVRLSLIHFGVGLLPFVVIGLVAGGMLHFTSGLGNRFYLWQGINMWLWIGGMVFSIMKTVGLAYEGVHVRKGSKYPVEDQLTDTAVMAGVYGVLVVLEGLLWWWDERSGVEEESIGSRSPISRYGFGKDLKPEMK